MSISSIEYIQSDLNTIGIDESGRGSMIGNVVAGAVILPNSFPDEIYKQIKDSKKLSFKKRSILAEYIKLHAITYGIGIASNIEIDNINILQATIKAMHRALNEAYKKHTFTNIIVDGNYFKPYMPPGIDKDALEHECILKGDSKYLNIAAASIIAKDYHDKEILKLLEEDETLVKYGLKSNMGYGTKIHLDAIKTYGHHALHRKSFKIQV